jgi:antirepressor (fragment)|nr:MAG TPA: hypothetical protein [Caudoviricetes sp.]
MKEQVNVLKQVELLGHQFTIYGTASNPLFLAKEVADIIFGDGRDRGTNARIVRGVDYFEKRMCIIMRNGVRHKLCMLTLQGVYEVVSLWKKHYQQPCFALNSYLLAEFGKPVPKEKITQVTNKESLTTKGDTVIRSKVIAKTSIGKKQPTVVVDNASPKKKKFDDAFESISIPKEAAKLIRDMQNPMMSAKDYLFEAICRLIEVMYDPESPEREYEMKDLFPLYQMAGQRKLINALQTH